MKLFYTIIYGVFTVLLGTVAVLYLLPNTPLTAHLDLKIVKSGSMEPTIMTGGLVAIVPASEYRVGDIVTFTTSGAEIPTTHRITAIETVGGQTQFVTKGDANEEIDTAPVSSTMILGKVVFDVPYVGFVLDFARQPVGFALLIVLPALLIIIDEIEKIWRAYRALRMPKQIERVIQPLVIAPYVPVHRPRMLDIGVPVRTQVFQVAQTEPSAPPRPRHFVTTWAATTVLVLLAVAVTTSFLPLGSTVAYYRNTHTSSENELRASSLHFTVEQVNPTALRVASFANSESLVEPITLVVTPGETSAPLIYDVSTEITPESDAAFCSKVRAEVTEPFSYSGPLTALSRGGIDTEDAWEMIVTPPQLPDGEPLALCEIDVIYSGWDARLPYQTGYAHTVRTRLSITNSETIAPIVLDESLVDGDIVEPIDDTKSKDKTENGKGGNGDGGKPSEDELPEAVGENNGHGNDEDKNDDSNPGASNELEDTTDDELPPAESEEDIADPAEDFEPEPTVESGSEVGAVV